MSAPVLEATGLHRSFGALKATNGVDLSVEPGEIHALIGPNGAGKSTLIQLLAGGLVPDAGTVRLAGEDVTRLGTASRARRGLARTFQISALAMEHSVLENVMLGRLAAEGGAARFWRPAMRRPTLTDPAGAALERVGLADLAGRRTADLSHGQRRQLEVAVALALAPRVFVMDEPMAGLGGDGSRRMTAFLDGLRAEAPILLVEHDMDAVFALADRISVLVEGQVIARGTPAEIRNDRTVRAAYLGEDG